MIERGKGVFVWDSDEKRYLDGASGCLVTNIGYGVVNVAEALKAEAMITGFSLCGGRIPVLQRMHY